MRREAWEAQQAIWDTPGLSTTARLIALCVLWHRNGKTGLCCPSRERVASLIGVSIPTVRRALKELKAAGVLVNTRTGKASRYGFPASQLVHGLGVTSDPSEGAAMTHQPYQGPFLPVVGEDTEMES